MIHWLFSKLSGKWIFRVHYWGRMRHYEEYPGTIVKKWLLIWSQSQCGEWYCWCRFGLIGWKGAAWCWWSFPLCCLTGWGRFLTQSWLPEWWKGEGWDSRNLRNRMSLLACPWRLEMMGIRKCPSMPIWKVAGGHWWNYLKILHFYLKVAYWFPILWCSSPFSHQAVVTLISLDGWIRTISHFQSYSCSFPAVSSLAITFLKCRSNPHPSLAVAVLAGEQHQWIHRSSPWCTP